MISEGFLAYLLVIAGTTYLVRMIPLVLCKKKIENRFVLSFLHYVPIAVLSAMTIPAIFYATDSIYTAAVGFISAVVLAYFSQSLVTVAAVSCLSVLAVELILKLF
ncbi:MAG: AzlD domain-containing protein [Ruminococcaceae bacterium]|nr:AzlD domain-containing protein [Oscillospiraceae bacterium]